MSFSRCKNLPLQKSRLAKRFEFAVKSMPRVPQQSKNYQHKISQLNFFVSKFNSKPECQHEIGIQAYTNLMSLNLMSGTESSKLYGNSMVRFYSSYF